MTDPTTLRTPAGERSPAHRSWAAWASRASILAGLGLALVVAGLGLKWERRTAQLARDNEQRLEVLEGLLDPLLTPAAEPRRPAPAIPYPKSGVVR